MMEVRQRIEGLRNGQMLLASPCGEAVLGKLGKGEKVQLIFNHCSRYVDRFEVYTNVQALEVVKRPVLPVTAKCRPLMAGALEQALEVVGVALPARDGLRASEATVVEISNANRNNKSGQGRR